MLRHIICFEDCVQHPLVFSWKTILAAAPEGSSFTPVDITPKNVAALVYTAGTTGPPKA